MKKSIGEEPGKIFVGGLTWNTTKEMLINEFLKYGEIVDSIILKNNETGISRGFGFVTFRDASAANLALDPSRKHVIDGKLIDVKLCNQKLAAQQRTVKQKSENCKIFVGGLPHNVTDEEIKQFFNNYGPVREFKMMYDETKQKPRGFGFITFELEESANQVLMEHYITFKGKQIEVKPQLHNIKQQQQSGGGSLNWNQSFVDPWNATVAATTLQPPVNQTWQTQQQAAPSYNGFGSLYDIGTNEANSNLTSQAQQQNWNVNYYPTQHPSQQQNYYLQNGAAVSSYDIGSSTAKLNNYENYQTINTQQVNNILNPATTNYPTIVQNNNNTNSSSYYNNNNSQISNRVSLTSNLNNASSTSISSTSALNQQPQTYRQTSKTQQQPTYHQNYSNEAYSQKRELNSNYHSSKNSNNITTGSSSSNSSSTRQTQSYHPYRR